MTVLRCSFAKLGTSRSVPLVQQNVGKFRLLEVVRDLATVGYDFARKVMVSEEA